MDPRFVQMNKASSMDFMRILRSLEEFLYEVMTWLVFYPRTLLRTALHPIEILDYSRAELRKAEDDQYQETISAPLFLMLSLVISHGVELALHLHPFANVGHGAEKLVGSDQNLIILRSLMFAVFPLMFALEQVRDAKQTLTRKSLRGPFYGECYPASVFCLVFGIGGTIDQAWPDKRAAGWAIMAVAIVWYLLVQIVWLKRFNDRWSRAIGVAVLCFLKASMVVFIVAVAVSLAILG
ncbi:hypothetical protein DDF67_05090 [Caulobacter endophyticus]|uniref:Yip1 domain-containing protein n=1 Tax=Caulobacter endophyticus TaxID=2172652 RepID=A0A2T9K9U6_9CAUL|nr:hypothetical protein DDF67_05090 [Caulobacter endophyticus]